jgi:glutamate/tyrosine decarboxylase-like PLP-dependent enzyme
MYTKLANDLHITEQILKEIVNESIEYQKLITDNDYFVAPKTEQTYIDSLPDDGSGALGALQIFKSKYKDKLIKTIGSRYYGFIVGGATPASLAGDWLTSLYDQCAMGIPTDVDYYIENETISMLKELFNLPNDFFGSFVSGATMSNFVNISIARQWAAKRLGVNVSEDGLYRLEGLKIFAGCPHSSIYKSLSMLGMGRNSLQLINQIPNREAMDVDSLEQELEKNKGVPSIVIASAGTVNTADFDDLLAISKLKEKYDFWLHVDAAFAGVAACSEKYSYLLNGMNNADSITIDAHKWLNVPYDSAIQFSKHKQLQLEVFYNGAAYLGGMDENPAIFNLTPENSRRMRSLPTWFSLLAYGKKGYQDIVERNCYIATLFSDKLDKSQEFRLLAPTKLNMVCFTLESDQLSPKLIHSFLDELRMTGQTFLTPTVYKGTPAIRIAVSNWKTTEKDVQIVWNQLSRLGEKYSK